ncbi:MAG: apolipoprotein N-acyltransferase [Leptolyngbyaceae cyanobacterium T60_A2020_046]|nr:apolipoprotein N-acyltransferase [Leptolyngbyaceae cyanobacterium T60_A2020_046]
MAKGASSPQGRNRPHPVANAESREVVRVKAERHPNPPSPLRSPLAIALLGGLLMGLCPEPIRAWPLAWVALAPLWNVITAPSSHWRPGWAFRLGLVWSLTYHGIVLSWITALHPLTWMGVPWLGSVAIALFAWAFITGLGGVTFGLWAVLLRGVAVRLPVSPLGRIVIGTALWCALETILSWGPLYWPSLSFTQSPHNGWILHLGQGSGPMAVTAAIVAVNGCWAEAYRALRPRPASGASRQPVAWQLGALGIALLVGLHGLGLGLQAHQAADDSGQALRIGLIQGNIPTREKLTPAGVRQALERYTEGYRALVGAGADAVLTPEGAIPEIWHRRYQSNSPLYRRVIEEGVPLWLGTFRPTADLAARSLTQSLVTLDATGQVISQYNKVKLVPLGEYIPFQAVLGGLISRLSPIEGSLSPGTMDQVFETPFGIAIAGICYESAYSELFRRQAAAGGEWIMTASNNDPYPPRMMRQHHAQDVMRAIESDRWAARVTNTGISGIVTPQGKTRWLSEPNQTVTHLATIYRRQTRTLYVRWGDWLTPLLLGSSGIIGRRAAAKRRDRTLGE